MIRSQAWAALGGPLTLESLATANLLAALVAAFGVGWTIVVAGGAAYLWLCRHKPRAAEAVALVVLTLVVALLTPARRRFR